MSFQKIYWTNGLKIDSDILNKSDAIYENRAYLANYLPYNLNKGILSFEIDSESLDTGLILVKKMEIYLDGKTHIFYDKSYPLSLQITEEELAILVPIYINVHEVIKESEETQYVYNQLSLSTNHDFTAEYSVKIASFRANNGCLEPQDIFLPLLSMDHYMMNEVFLKINKLISSIMTFNKHVFSVSRPHSSIYLDLLLMRLKRDSLFAEAHKSNIHPYAMFNLIHDIYILLTSDGTGVMKQANKNISFDFNDSYRQLIILISELEHMCANKSVKNFVQFKPQAEKYICDSFPLEFFNAERFYFVVKRKEEAETNDEFKNISKVRITSISRYTQVVNLSLSGLKLQEMDSSVNTSLTMSLNKSDKVFQIIKNTEWDFVLADKSAVFTASEGCENFDFFIAFI